MVSTLWRHATSSVSRQTHRLDYNSKDASVHTTTAHKMRKLWAMMPAIPLVSSLADIQADAKSTRHTKRILNSVARQSPEAHKLVKYLVEFVTMSCAPDMLALRVFPNAKEISESFGAYDAVRCRLPEFGLKDPTVTVVAVGDGTTPRTAATFAMRSAWTCYSVDPLLRGGIARWSAIKRLHIVPSKIEDVRIDGDKVIVIAVHSHARLDVTLRSITAREMLAVVAMPCCVPLLLDRPPDIEYDESGVISPCRTIKIWRLP
jgi:hypothetical protein